MDSVLNRIVSNDTKNQKEQAKQTDLLADILGVQKDILKVEENRTKQEARERQRARRGAADKPTTLKKLFEKDSKDKKGGILAMLGKAIGGVVGGIGALGLLKALGITALGGAITAMFTSKEFRDMIFGAFGNMKDAIGNYLFGKEGVFNAKQRKEIADNLKEKLGNFVKRFTDPIVKFLDEFELKMLKLNNKAKSWLNKFLTGRDTDDARDETKSRVDQIEGKLAAAKLRKDKEKIKALEKELADAKAKDLMVQQADSMRNQRKSVERRLATRGQGAVRGEQRAALQQKLEDLNTNIRIKEGQMSDAGISGYQNGGFVGTVPFMGGNGDRFPAMLSSGSVVLNQTAAGMMQNGGMVPTLLEQGEQVYSPRDPAAGAALMMNSMIPRFQNGGEVTIPPSQASVARGGNISSGQTPENAKAEMEAAKSTEGQAGLAAIIKASEKSTGLMAGISEQCANATRAVLRAAGHPAAGKNTQLGDLDPEGTRYSAPSYAASFAGSDMGKVGSNLSAASPGSILLWKDTYGNYAPGAITHVGIAGEGNTQYDHGSSSGWRKRSRNSLASNFAHSVDLNGQATGYVPGSYSDDEVRKGLNPLLQVFAEFGALFGGMKLGDGFNLKGADDPSSPGMPSGSGSLPSEGASSIVSSGSNGSFREFYQMAKTAGAKYPEVVAAQWQLESASGSAVSGKNNYFGIKAAKGEAGTVKSTWEHIGGQDITTNAKFKDFQTPQDSVNHLVSQWHKDYKGYSGVNNAEDAYAAARMLRTEGYATDPNYTTKLINIMKTNGYQRGGVANMRGTGSQTTSMVKKSQEQFAQQIASATTPVIVPVPSGGGGGGRDSGAGASTTFPVLASEDSSIVSMEYKYRITMGASV